MVGCLNTEISSWQLDVVTSLVLVVVEQRAEAVVGDVHESVLLASDVGDHHVVGGGADILVLLAGEDVDADQVDLGVAVLARLRRRHFDDLTRSLLEQHEAVLTQRRALLWERLGRARLAG